MQHASVVIKLSAVLTLCLLFAAVAAAQDGSGSQHFVFTESNLHLVQSYGINYPQTTQDITSASGAPLAGSLSGGLASLSLVGGTELIYFIGANAHIYQIHCCSWSYADISAVAGAPVALSTSTLTAYVNSSGLHVAYEGTNQHIYLLFYSYSTSSWGTTDLTTVTSGALAVSKTPLTSYADTAGEHVAYLGTNESVYLMYLHTGGSPWVNQNLTTSGPVASAGSGLSSFADSFGEHIYYISSGAVRQLYLPTNGTPWQNQNLQTTAPNAPLALSTSALTSYSDPSNATYGPGGEHVFYWSQLLQLTELLYINSWTAQTVLQDTESNPAALVGLPGYQTSAGIVDYEQVAQITTPNENPCTSTNLAISQYGQPNIPDSWTFFCPTGAAPSLQSSLTGFINP